MLALSLDNRIAGTPFRMSFTDIPSLISNNKILEANNDNIV